MKLKSIFGLAAIGLLSVSVLTACGSKESKGADDPSVVRVGLMAKSESEEARWDKVEELLEDQGVTIEYTEFTDYSQPNKALNNGENDINAFQHYNFLNNWNSENDADLTAIAETYFTAFRLYSGTENGKNSYTDVSQIPDDAVIAIPNDVVNESRALYLLRSAGFIKLDVSGDTMANLSNIIDNPKNLDIKEVDAAQTAANLTSVDAAVINNDFVTAAGIDPSTAIFIEPASDNSKQWYNLLVAQKDWEKSDKAESIKKVIQAYQTDEVRKVIEESSQGLDEPIW